MAAGCIYTYNGNEYTEKEFKALVLKGEFDAVLKDKFFKESISSQSNINNEKDNGKGESQSNQESNAKESSRQESGSESGNGKNDVIPPKGGEPKSSSPDSESEPGKRSFTKQALNKEEILPASKAEIAKTIDYAIQKNAMSIKEAGETIDKLGVDEAFALVTNLNNELNGGVRGVMGQVLILKYNDMATKFPEGSAERNYYVDKTIDVANFVTDKLSTMPGQTIQSLSLFSRLSPEAQLRAAIKDQKKQGEEKVAKIKPVVDEIANKLKKINEETAEEITASPKVKESVEKRKQTLSEKAGEKIKKAKENRSRIIEKYKKDKGKNLYAGVGLTKEGIEFAGDLIKTYIDEGIAEVQIIVDKVLTELKNVSGKDVTDAVSKNVSDLVQERVLKMQDAGISRELKNLEKEVRAIVKEHYTVTASEKKKLTDKFIEKLGLEKSEAEGLAKEIESEFDRIATRKKQDLLTEEKKRFDKIQEGIQGSKKDKTIESEIIRFSNLGAFDNNSLLDMVAAKLGVGQLTPEQGKRITELAEKIQKSPEGSPKNNATEQLLKYRADIKGTSWSEVAQGVWYAQVLSGYATHIKNLVSTFFNSVGYFTVEAALNPKSIPYLMLGAGRGLAAGVAESKHTVRTGQTPIHISKIETPDVLERKIFAGGYLNPVNYLKYVGRLMKAEDVLLFQGLKEMRATQLAYREANRLGYKNPFSKETYKKVNELLLNTKGRYEGALFQATAEGVKGSELSRRVYELMEMSRPIQMTEDAYGFAAKGTFNHEVEGTLGALTLGISKLLDIDVAGAKPLRFVVPFTRIITNVTNNAIDFSPLGFVRAAKGSRGFKSFEGNHIVKDAYHKMSAEERRQTIAKASLGTLSMATLYALSASGLVQVSGAGPSDIKKKLQLIEEGWQPYSIKIGDKFYSYKLTPFVFAFGLVGSIRDHEQYDKDADEQSILQRTMLSTWDGVKNISDMTWVGSAAPLMGAMTENNGSKVASILGNTATRTLKSFVPVLGSNLYAQTAQKLEQVFNVPQKKASNLWQSLIQDVPIARNMLNDKINALGDPVIKDVDILTSRENPDPVWQYLFDKKGWVAPVNKNTIIVLDEDTKMERPVTEDEYYEFSKIRGGKIKKELQDVINNGVEVDGVRKTAQQLTSAQLQKIISSKSTQATKETKKELFEKAKKERKEKIKVIH